MRCSQLPVFPQSSSSPCIRRPSSFIFIWAAPALALAQAGARDSWLWGLLGRNRHLQGWSDADAGARLGRRPGLGGRLLRRGAEHLGPLIDHHQHEVLSPGSIKCKQDAPRHRHAWSLQFYISSNNGAIATCGIADHELPRASTSLSTPTAPSTPLRASAAHPLQVIL